MKQNDNQDGDETQSINFGNKPAVGGDSAEEFRPVDLVQCLYEVELTIGSEPANRLGLDIVELIMRVEDVFVVSLADEECSKVRTVGDLYRLLLEKLRLSYLATTEIELSSAGANRLGKHSLQLNAWNQADVWITLKAVIEDQIGVSSDTVRETTNFIDDLRCD